MGNTALEDVLQTAAVAVANANASNANGPTSIPAFAPTGEPADDYAAAAPPSAEVLDDPVARCLVSLSQAFWAKHTGDEIDHVLQHVLFPLARRVETPECVCWLFRVIRSMTFGFEAVDQSRKDAFATDKVRDEIFLRLHVCATTSVAVYWLFRALNCITRCVGLDHEADRQRQRVFATASIRDLFVSRARVQKDTMPGVVQWLFRAMQNLTAFSSADDRDGFFATVQVRDGVFVPLALHATTPESATSFFNAMVKVLQGPGPEGAGRRRNFLGCREVRDAAFLPVVQFARSPAAVSALCDAVCEITSDDSPGSDGRAAAARRNAFGTPDVRDRLFLSLSPCAKDEHAVQALSSAIRSVTSGEDEGAAARQSTFSVLPVRKMFVSLIHYAASPDAKATLRAAMCAGVQEFGGSARPHSPSTAEHLVAEFGELVKNGSTERMCDLLREMPGLARSADADGVPPLHHAVRGGHVDVVELLLTFRAHPLQRSSDRAASSALEVSVEHGTKNITLLLVAALAREDDARRVLSSAGTPTAATAATPNTDPSSDDWNSLESYDAYFFWYVADVARRARSAARADDDDDTEDVSEPSTSGHPGE